MNKYHNGKIYTIRSNKTEQFYIGSTTQPLSKRFYEHKHHMMRYNNCKFSYISSFEIVKHNDCYIELLEAYSCNNKDELTKREGELIRLNKDKCVNVKIAGRTRKEYKEDNKDKIKQQYEDNKDKIKEHSKLYYQDNKDKIQQQQKQQCQCQCGSKYTMSNKTRHDKSKKHQTFITNI